MSHFVWKLRRRFSFNVVMGHMTELQGCLIFFLLYLLFGEFGVQFVESECLCVCVCVHLCVSARQERTCPHMVGLHTAIFWFASLHIRDWLHIVPVFHHRKISLPALNKSHEQTSVTSGNEFTTQCVYYSSTLKLEYLSFSAEWLENTSLLRGTGSRPPSHCTEDSPLLSIIDTTATGCSEMRKKFCYIASHPRHIHSLPLPNAKCKI